MVQTRHQAKAAEQPHGYESFGPPGVFALSFGLPVLCHAILFICNDKTGCPAPSLLSPSTLTLDKLKQEVGWEGYGALFSIKAFMWTLAYYAVHLVLWRILPGVEVEGSELKTGGKLKYKNNAFAVAMTLFTLLGAGTIASGGPDHFPVWTFIWENYIQLVTSNILIAYALANFSYIRSFSVRSEPSTNPDDNPENNQKLAKNDPGFAFRELAAPGVTGNILYDWFMGRELNPPVHVPLLGTLDIKSFMELRPGMIGWFILNLAFAARQYKNYGTTTASMILVIISQGSYILDALWSEPAILTTMDITTDGFGFMLSFGDLVWVPFIYSLQARYLAVHPVQLSPVGIALPLAALVAGYSIFRGSNNQKNKFRTLGPNDKDQYIQTARGTKLLCSGWWGAARHINYLGDWLLSWSYCLPTAFAGYMIQPSSPFRDHPHAANSAIRRDDFSVRGGDEVVPGEAQGFGMCFTYFYLVFLAVLLVYRERRDDEKCRRKYGADWEEYCKRVPARIIPGIY